MKSEKVIRICTAIGLIALIGLPPVASAAGPTLSVATTSLGKIVVNGKGLTAYFYDLDVANSGVSACTGSCLVNWPPIISKSAAPTFSRVTGKVTVMAGTKQIEINGRPIYTFIGDSTKGSVRGQGLEDVWYVISPAGVELNPTNLAKLSKESATPKPKKTSRY
jgi:predicted lipoprotein with Yx(FWY)xxD motif